LRSSALAFSNSFALCLIAKRRPSISDLGLGPAFIATAAKAIEQEAIAADPPIRRLPVRINSLEKIGL
jgi:hypothetical protein